MLALFAIVMVFSGASNNRRNSSLWQSWPEIQRLMLQEPRPIIIDIYTNWCHYCKAMDATTYRNDSVRSYLKKNFYRYKLNAEVKKPIEWIGKTFGYNSRMNVHEMAVYLTGGAIVYPTTVIVTPDGQPFNQAGMLRKNELELLVKYFAENNRQQISLQDYALTFKPMW